MSKTHIALVLDMSGSMTATEEATREGVAAYIKQTKKDIPESRFSLTVFDTVFEKWIVDARLGDLSPKGVISNYRPRGGTALYDAIGKTVSDLKARVKKNDKAIVVIMTDGQENSSKEYYQTTIRDLVTSLQEKGNWTFIFLGANIDTWRVGQHLGFFRSNTVDYSYGAGQKRAFVGTAKGSTSLSMSPNLSSQVFYEDANVSTEDFVDNQTDKKSVKSNKTENLWTPGGKSGTTS